MVIGAKVRIAVQFQQPLPRQFQRRGECRGVAEELRIGRHPSHRASQPSGRRQSPIRPRIRPAPVPW